MKGGIKVKKVFIILFGVLILASCSNQAGEVSEISEKITVSSEISEEKSEDVSQVSEEVSETAESSAEVSEESEIKEISTDISDYSKQLVEKAVDVEKLGKRTKAYLVSVLESRNIYMNVTGELAVLGGIGIKFNAEVGRSDNGITEKFTLGENSVKIIQNGDGTYIIDDKNKTAELAGGAYEPNVELQTADGYTQNSIANDIISYISAGFGLKSLNYNESGKEDYKGKKYDFDEYSADGKTVKVYFDGEKPVYITSSDGANISEIEINSFTAEPDENIFKVPDGYNIVS